MEVNMMIEAERLVKSIPGPNASSFDSEKKLSQKNVKFVGETLKSYAHENGISVHCNYKASARNVSYLDDEEKEDVTEFKGNHLVDNHGRELVNYKDGEDCRNITCKQSIPIASENNLIGSLNSSVDVFAFGSSLNDSSNREGQINTMPELTKQMSCGAKVRATPRLKDDSEISVFDASLNFNAEEDRKLSSNVSRQGIRKPKGHLKDGVFISHGKLYDSSHRQIYTPESSKKAMFRGIVSKGRTATMLSEVSWNRHSALLSNAGSRLPASDRKTSTLWKWVVEPLGFWFKCPCSSKHSVEIKDSLTQSVSCSTKYNYPGLGNRILGGSLERQRSEGSCEDDSGKDILNSIDGQLERYVKPMFNIENHNSGLCKDGELIRNLQRKSASFRYYETVSDVQRLRETRRLSPKGIDGKENGFFFLIPDSCPELFVEVLGSAGQKEYQRTSYLQSQLLPFSPEKPYQGYTLNSQNHKFPEPKSKNDSTYCDQDKESDSSSDLFEIETLTTSP